jgi:hypothetical protein
MGKLEHLRVAASSALPAPGPAGGRKTYNLAEAAHFLRIHPEELRQRTKAGRVPGAKIGRAWVFLEDDLVAYLRSHYPSPRQALQVTLGKEVECHLSNATQSGGSKSELPTESEYADLLGLETKPSRRNTTTR